MKLSFVYDDGGREKAGFKGTAGDCVCRSIAIASSIDYKIVYKTLASLSSRYEKRHGARKSSARNGVFTQRKWFKDYMRSIGFAWTPCMAIGTGCKVHLHDDELPEGRLIVALSKHFTAVINGIIHDLYDPRREVHSIYPDDGRTLKTGEWRNSNGICKIERRCVYGFWKKIK